MKALHIIAWILLIVGGLNWALDAMGWNVVDSIFGAGSRLATWIYYLVGIAAVVELFTHGKNCRMCKPGMSSM